jgi:hypothetical protein
MLAALLAGHHDHLGGGAMARTSASVARPSADPTGIGRQAEIEQHDLRRFGAHGGQRQLAIAGLEHLEGVERPAQLLAQGQIVLDDEQPPFGHAGCSTSSSAGRQRAMVVPWPGLEARSKRPPTRSTVLRA